KKRASITKIVYLALQTNKPNILLLCILMLLGIASAGAQERDSISSFKIPLKNDSLLFSNDTLIGLVPPEILSDSIASDSTKQKKKELLEHNIKQSAKDWIRNDLKEQKVYLYNEARIEYGDMTLTAGKIVLDNETREVYAYGIKDTADNYTQRPVFTQGGQKVEPDSIRMNIDTKRALVHNSRTEQGEFKIKGEVT